MARNAVQFQKGLSMAEFLRRYGTEEQCHAALVAMRWPDGFVCPRCAETKYSYCEPKRLFQCTASRLQTAARAGTILPQIAHAAGEMVPRHALDDEREERYRRSRIGSPTRRQMGHRLSSCRS